MERKIGEIFEYNGEWYQCGEGRCRDCYFSEERYLCKQFITKGFCTSGIIYKKLEKVGEPYTHYCPSGRIIYFQRYKLFYKLYSHNTEYIMCDFNEDGIVSIEIKQTKEDMEEKKTPLPKEDNALTRTVYAYVNGEISDKELIRSIKEMTDEYPYNKNNLKPFSLELAKQGKPVCTRDGRKARIVSCSLRNKNFPIAAIVEDEEENVYQFEANGVCDEHDENLDLMILPEKKEGWVNVYRDCDGANITKDDNIYSSREAAIASAQFIDGNHYVATTKINWEEQLQDWISNYTLEI